MQQDVPGLEWAFSCLRVFSVVHWVEKRKQESQKIEKKGGIKRVDLTHIIILDSLLDV